MRRVLRLILLCLLLAAGPARARPYTVDDLLQSEELGQVVPDPTGRRLVIEVSGPRAGTARFDYGGYTRWRAGRLLTVDLDHPGPAQPLFDQPATAGYVAGPFSPDGGAMVVYRLGERFWEAGIVTLATGQVRWLGITPELALLGRAAVWRSNHELLLIARPDGELPRQLAQDWRGIERAARLRGDMAQGRSAVTVTGVGRFSGDTPLPAESRLLTVDVRTGEARSLTTGDFVDVELSARRRYAALVAEGARVGPPQDTPFAMGTPLRRRRLILVDLETGAVTAPCPACDPSSHLLTWSPGRDRLLIHDRAPGADGVFVAIDAIQMTHRTFRLGELVPALATNREGMRIPQAGWLGDDPVVRARARGDADGRADWYQIGRDRTRNLTAAFRRPPERIEAAWTGRWIVMADGGQWVLSADGAPPHLIASGALTPSPAFGEGQRFAYSAPPHITAPILTQTNAAGSMVVRTGSPDAVVLGPTQPPPSVRTAAARGVVIQTVDPHGQVDLAFRSWSGVTTPLLTLNRRLETVDVADIEPVRHAGPDGQALTSWLYLPHDRQPGARLPLVVMPYPGLVYASPPAGLGPGRPAFHMNPELFAAQGYAVLLPSLPRRADGEPAAGLADQILSVTDAALARGDLDPERLALYGQSFGGYAALVTATQTYRFRSIIAAAPVSDLAAMWGATDLYRRVAAEAWPAVGGAGWVEAGQAALGAPPWADPPRYRRNSPLFAADKIATPILLLQGSEDDVPLSQSEAMLHALWRQNKDAELAIYWGEGHAVMSPGNSRDYYGRVFSWLSRTLPPASGATP